MRVLAKMRCQGMTGYPGVVTVSLGAVYSTDENDPNREFSRATPSASLNLGIADDVPAARAFEHGREYFVLIVPVEEATPDLVGKYAPTPAASPEPPLADAEQSAHALRVAVKGIAEGVKALGDRVKRDNVITGTPLLPEGADRGEVIANVTLAYRHLEDASMRLGKAIQAANGGTSVYDRTSTVGA